METTNQSSPDGKIAVRHIYLAPRLGQKLKSETKSISIISIQDGCIEFSVSSPNGEEIKTCPLETWQRKAIRALADGYTYQNFNDLEARLLMDAAQLETGHLLKTREQYQAWVRRYRSARMSRICGDLQGFLTYLASDPKAKVNPKSVKQALNALKFYHENVLGILIPPNSLKVPRVNPHKNIPVWLTHEEAVEIISKMDGEARLQAELQYGTGSRIGALLKLRMKDLCLQTGLITFRMDKGGKSRVVQIPQESMPRLITHISAVRLQWEQDSKRGIICPEPEPRDMAKSGPRRYSTWPYCWLFPSDVTREKTRWHATDHALTDQLKRSAEECGINKRITTHILRHSNATALLERGENPRDLQEHLGHTHLETTEIYLHARGVGSMVSPLDAPPRLAPRSLIPFPSAISRIRRASII